MRRGWNGITISRDTIHIEGMELGYKRPVLFERHAVGGESLLPPLPPPVPPLYPPLPLPCPPRTPPLTSTTPPVNPPYPPRTPPSLPSAVSSHTLHNPSAATLPLNPFTPTAPLPPTRTLTCRASYQ